ncbi:MAG: prepilin-type N-terminal cleavage/methylation domain-containing protein [Minisyncoccia bacterium]
MKLFFKKNKKGRGEKGFTLVETLVAISIFTVSILGLLSVLSKGISDTGYAKKKTVAGYLAQEGIEYIRNMRDTNALYTLPGGWNNFKTKISSCTLANRCGFDVTLFPQNVFVCTTHSNQCKLYEQNGNYNTNSIGVDSGFVRTVYMETVSADNIKIFSTVSWTQGSGQYDVTFSENLFNWTE